MEGIDLQIRLDSLFLPHSSEGGQALVWFSDSKQAGSLRVGSALPSRIPLGLGSVPDTQKALSTHLLNTETLDFTGDSAFCENGAKNSESQSEPARKCCPPGISDI